MGDAQYVLRLPILCTMMLFLWAITLDAQMSHVDVDTGESTYHSVWWSAQSMAIWNVR